MSGALEKFGIYDFMGIWGPGAITVTYFWFTLGDTIQLVLDFLRITIPISEELHKLIILYSAVAYTTGVILHELGKLLAERTTLFSTSTVKNCSFCKMAHKGFGGKIREEYKSIVSSVIPNKKYISMKFHEALNELKCDSKVCTKRIDTYHSVYGMSRSLSLSFIIHAVVELAVFLCGNFGDRVILIFIVADIILSIFFLNRAYRYFCSWVRNVFIQRYLVKK